MWVVSCGWNVVVIDNDKRGLDWCRFLVERYGVEASVRMFDLDLNKCVFEEMFVIIDKIFVFELWLFVLVVYVVRYFYKLFVRDLLRMLSNRSAVLWFYFMWGCECIFVG